MEKENDKLQDIADSQLLKEELLDLEDVDALLEQVMQEAQQQEVPKEEMSFEDEELQRMDTIMEHAATGVPLDDEILTMLKALEEEEAGIETAGEMNEEGSVLSLEDAILESEMGFSGEAVLANEMEFPGETVPEYELTKPEKEKKSFLRRILDFIFESDEEESEELIDGQTPDEAETGAVRTVGAGKDKKKEKGKKGGKHKNVTSADDNAAIAAEMAAEDKKKKEKKAKKVKEKKEKPEREEEPKEKSGIGVKGIIATLMVCFSLLGVILAVCYALPSYLSMREARKAFYEKDYAEALHRFHGYHLNKSDEILYKKARVLQSLDVSYKQYEVYKKRGLTKEAVNALFDGYKICQKKRILAEQYGITEEWELYQGYFMEPLMTEYGMQESDIELVCTMKPLEYTIVLDNLVAGAPFDVITLDSLLSGKNQISQDDNSENGLENDEENVTLEDMLPEEEALLKALEEQQEQEKSEEASKEENIPLYEGTVIDGEVILYEYY